MPKRYHSQFRWSEFDGDETALLLFRHDREDVILSTVVRRAIESVGDISEPLRIAVGGDFTQEALGLLHAAGFRTFRLGDWFWTDESYRHITKATV